MTGYQQPTNDELERVAAYWQRVEALACPHETITYTSNEAPTCGSCGHPVRILSDLQIDDMIDRARRRETDR